MWCTIYKNWIKFLLTSVTLSAFAVTSVRAEPAPTPAPFINKSAVATSATSTAPGASAEADALWNDSIEKFAARDWLRAAAGFQLLLDKFASDGRALDARFYLGQAYFQLDRYSDALPTLRAFVESAGIKPERQEARLYLIRAYLGAEKYSEALLAVQDYDSALTEASAAERARVLLYRAQAQIGLKQNLEAERNLSAFFAAANDSPDLGPETTEGSLVRLRLKGIDCERFPSSRELTEDQVIDQYKRRSLCTVEIAGLLSTMGKNPDEKRITSGFTVFEANLTALRDQAADPALGRGKRTASEWKRAKSELATRLGTEWNETLRLAYEVLRVRENFAARVAALRKKFGGPAAPATETPLLGPVRLPKSESAPAVNGRPPAPVSSSSVTESELPAVSGVPLPDLVPLPTPSATPPSTTLPLSTPSPSVTPTPIPIPTASSTPTAPLTQPSSEHPKK